MNESLALFLGGAFVAVVFAGVASLFAPRMASRAPANTARVVMWSYVPMWMTVLGLGNVMANGDDGAGSGYFWALLALPLGLGLYWLAGRIPVVRRHRAIMAEAYGARGPSILVDTGGYRAQREDDEGQAK